jgi:hypothetical protein
LHHFTQMLSIEKCKKILKIANETVEDEKIIKLIELLTVIAEVTVDTIINEKTDVNENSCHNEPRQ